MLNVEVDEKMVRDLMQQAIDEKVDELAHEKFFITYNELASYLSISKPVIEEKLIKNGLKYYKVGSKYLFRKQEVDAFLNDMTASMTATNNDIKLFKKLKK